MTIEDRYHEDEEVTDQQLRNGLDCTGTCTGRGMSNVVGLGYAMSYSLGRQRPLSTVE